jgi:hypothetical protein
MHAAANKNRHQMVTALLAAKADPNIQNKVRRQCSLGRPVRVGAGV